MVAFVSSNSLDLAVANTYTGRPDEGTGTNSATGNLVIQKQDEFLAGIELDAGLVRTYNSQGLVSDDIHHSSSSGAATHTSAPAVTHFLTIAAAADGINATEKAAGVNVTAYLPAGTLVGDRIELLIDGARFATPVSHVITKAELAAHKVSLTIVGNDPAWGVSGDKVISARIIDTAGNVGVAGGNRTVRLNIGNASPLMTKLAAPAATKGVSAAEKAAGVAVTMALAGIHATAGDVVELLINGRAFARPVIHVLTTAEVKAGSATLTVEANAGWGGDGSKTLSARIKNAAGDVNALSGSTTVTLDTSAPTVTNFLTIAAAASGINMTEKASGVAVVVYPPASSVAGDTVELLIDGSAFAKPVTHVLTAAEAGARKVTLTISGDDSAWGTDGSKVISARIIDSAGNVGKAGGDRTVRLDTHAPGAATHALSIPAAANNGIKAAEKAAGVDVVMDLTGTGAVAGDTVELLIGDRPFATPVKHVLTGAEVTAQSAMLTIPGAAGWGADGSKTLTARVSNSAGNAGAAGGALTVTLDTAAPGVPSHSITAATADDGINAAEQAAGVAFTVDLAGTDAAAGHTLELLRDAGEFAVPVTHVLTATEIGAAHATLIIPGNAGWGADGGKTITARVTDAAGNVGIAGGDLSVMLDSTPPTAPTNVLVIPMGGTIVANTLNSTNTQLTVQATIAAGEATGGSAVLKIGGVTIATYDNILANDTTVTFTTSDGSPTNAELQAAVAAGGGVTVTLIDAAGNATTSSAGNPTLTVDYGVVDAPTAVTASAVNGTIVANTLNATNTHLIAQATITAGEATGGSAALKIGGATIAIYDNILANDTTVTFTTSDGSPTNAELQAAVAAGGDVTVTLIDAHGNTSISTVGNPILSVDYTPPDSPIIPIAVAAGNISATEKAAGVAVDIDLSGTDALTGDTVELLIDGASFTTPITHMLDSSEVTAGHITLHIAGNDSAWGADGSKTLTARVTDAAGNVGAAGGDLVLHLDTGSLTAAVVDPLIYADEDGDGVISVGDTFTLTFNKATNALATVDDLVVDHAHTLGFGATAIWSGDGTQLIVTLGSGANIAFGDMISAFGVADIAGNTANIDFVA